MHHVYQPIVDLRTGRPAAFEALARFRGRGPQAVLAEVSARGDAAMRRFDREAIASAVSGARGQPPGVPLFLNATSATVAAVLRGEPWPGTDGVPVVWELNESGATAAVLAAHGPDAVATLGRSAALALDDVGDGRGDLGRLAAAVRGGVRWVKLARSVVDGCARDSGKRAVLQAVARLGVPVIAEGVERQDDLHTVAAVGIRYVQGFAVGRPAPLP